MRRLTLICIFLKLICAISASDAVIELNGTIIASREDVSKLNYPNATNVTMNHPKVYALTREMLLQLNSTIDFRVREGEVPTVELVPQFRKMMVFRCNTNELTIDPNLEYEIYTLYVSRNNFKTIPDNIGALKKLKNLWLMHNKIESVDMEDFDGLQQLESLFLYGNRIVEISNPQCYPISLPNLRSIRLDANRLRFINFEHWDMPLLHKIQLRGNKLVVALFLSSQKFVSLKEVSLRYNSWNCQWLSQTTKELEIGNISLYSYYDSDRIPPTCQESAESLDEMTNEIQIQEQTKVCQNPRKARSKFQKMQEQIRAQANDNAKMKVEITDLSLENQKLRTELEQTKQSERKEKEKLNKSLQKMTEKARKLQSFSVEHRNFVEQSEEMFKCFVKNVEL